MSPSVMSSSSSSSLPDLPSASASIGSPRPLPPPDKIPSRTYHGASASCSDLPPPQQQLDMAAHPSSLPPAIAECSFISPAAGYGGAQAHSTRAPCLPSRHSSSAPCEFPSPLLQYRHGPGNEVLPNPSSTSPWSSEAAKGGGGDSDGARACLAADPWRRSFANPTATYAGGVYGGNTFERGVFHPTFELCKNNNGSTDDYGHFTPSFSPLHSHRDLLFAADQSSALRYRRLLGAAHSSAAAIGAANILCGDPELRNIFCGASSPETRMVSKSQSMRALYEENAALRRALYSIRSGGGVGGGGSVAGGGFTMAVDSQAATELGVMSSTDRFIASDGAEGRAISMRERGRWALQEGSYGGEEQRHQYGWAQAQDASYSCNGSCRARWPHHAPPRAAAAMLSEPLCCAAAMAELKGSNGGGVQQLHQLFSIEAEERRKAAERCEDAAARCAMCGGDMAAGGGGGRAGGRRQGLPLRLCAACQPAAVPGGPAGASARHRLAAAISIACRPSPTTGGGKGGGGHKRLRPRFLDFCRQVAAGFTSAAK